MPELTREELWQQLKQDVLAPVYVLYGAEPFLRDRAANEITRRAFSDNDLRDFNYDEYSLNDPAKLEAAIAAAEQLPMMSARRVVKLTDVRVTASSNRDTLVEAYEALLARYLADPSPSTTLIFLADELNGNRRMTRLLKQHATSIKFVKLLPHDIDVWIARQFSDQGFVVDAAAVKRLAGLVGPDLRRLTNEIEKLCTASLPSKKIDVPLVEALATNSNELDNFALSGAVLSGRGGHALAVLNKILNDGAEPVALLGLLSYNFRRLLIAKETMERGGDRGQLSSYVTRGMRPDEQQQFLSAARRADRKQLIKVFDRLYETDLAMKTSVAGGGDQGSRMQIEVLVCEIAAAMKR